MTNNRNRPWPHDKPHGTSDTRVTYVLIHDWRWQRFDEIAVPDPDVYPIYGWKRVRVEETESGQRSEVREWSFGVERPNAVFREAA